MKHFFAFCRRNRLFGALLAVMVLIPTVYSYALHRKGI